ncbi:MAG: PQQ-binding-like beta-propeller repeat protein [Ignavibacteriales bacterium]|nr:PQQ-binding-like beta-propeller repeat protein [Ignavibacteriales bacterium]
MQKIFLFIFLFIQVSLYPQVYKFAWLTDTHIGAPEADNDLMAVVSSINQNKDIKFVIISGDITEKGRDSEFDNVYELLSNLNKSYFIIPGNHDTKWSESGCLKFLELFNDDKFSFEFEDEIFIGINTGIPWRGGGGHIALEDLDWVKEKLIEIPKYKRIFLFIHHPLDDIDNSYLLINLFNDYNLSLMFCGHGHSNKKFNFNNIICVMSRATLNKNQVSWGYNLVEVSKDTIVFYNVDKNPQATKWASIILNKSPKNPKIDSIQFLDFHIDLLSSYDLQQTLVSPVLIEGEKIYSVTKSGLITCSDLNGNILWNYESNSYVYSKPIITNKTTLIIGTLHGELLILNSETGELVQSIGVENSITSKLSTLEYIGNKEFLIPKRSESKSAVIFGTSAGELFCYDIETLQEIWNNRDAKGMIETKPLIFDNKIYFGSWDGYLYCIDAKEGWLNWKWSAQKNFYYSPAACEPQTDGKNIFIATPDKYVYAIDALLGITKWKTNEANAWESIGISIDKKRLLIKSVQNNFSILSSEDGKEIKEINIDNGVDTTPIEPIEHNGNILFSSANGNIYLIDNNFELKKILFLGNSRTHTVQHIKENIFVVSNMDGKVVVFKLKEKI